MDIQNISNAGGAAYSPAAAPATEATKSGGASASTPVAPVQEPKAAPKLDEVRASVDKINKTIQTLDRNLEFTIDEDTKQNVVKVVDKITKDIIRQFPSEEALVIAKALDKVQGLLLKEKG